jgi:hypothetical protein
MQLTKMNIILMVKHMMNYSRKKTLFWVTGLIMTFMQLQLMHILDMLHFVDLLTVFYGRQEVFDNDASV